VEDVNPERTKIGSSKKYCCLQRLRGYSQSLLLKNKLIDMRVFPWSMTGKELFLRKGEKM
jgi:hypothetical protein